MKRSILSLMYLIQGMRKSGVDIEHKLHAIGLNENSIDPSSVIHPNLEWDILQTLGRDIEPIRGLDIGQHYSLAGYGPLLMLIVASETIKDALENGVKYSALTHLTGKLSFSYKDEQVSLNLIPLDLNTSIGELIAHCEISGTYRFLKDIYQMMGLEIPVIEISLPFIEPINAEAKKAYTDIFGTQISFRAKQAEFNFGKDVLNVEIPSADPITYKAYDQKCVVEMERLAEENKTPSLIQRVTDYLELQNRVFPTMAETAQALRVPERTLRHQLQQMNTSYKQIREDLIKDKALRLMEYKEYSIEMIAELLGYSEPAAFNHAFKRWFGQSPRQYK
jgi:AraC-like DNA-binding protein